MITYDTSPECYRHWALLIDAPIAVLTAAGDGGGADADEPESPLLALLRPDLELADAVQRLRFGHPDVGAVVVMDPTDAAFSRSAAGIPAGTPPGIAAIASDLRADVHDAIEDAGVHSGQRWMAGRDDPAATERARSAAAGSRRGPASEAVVFGPLRREEFDGGFAYPNIRVEVDEGSATAELTVVGPASQECFAPEPGPRRLRWRWWPLAVCRELDDALLLLRMNWPGLRSLVLRTEGDALAVASADVALGAGYEHDWFVREVVLYWKRTLRRLDRIGWSVSAVLEPGSCFVGTLFELALVAPRVSLVEAPEGTGSGAPQVYLTGMNFGPLPRADGLTRLQFRLRDRDGDLAALDRRVGEPISGVEAAALGLVTAAGPPADGAGPAPENQVVGGSGTSR